MPFREFLSIVLRTVLLLFAFTFSVHADVSYRIDRMVQGLDAPWGMAVLPNGQLLVTEKAGQLLLIDGTGRHTVTGVPQSKDCLLYTSPSPRDS